MQLFIAILFTLQSVSILQSPQEFKASTKQGLTIVDVRTPEEFSLGAVPNAINISVTSISFPFEISKLDKEKPVMVYCKSGPRSARAALAMKALGFSTIYELDGGYRAWQKHQSLIEQ